MSEEKIILDEDSTARNRIVSETDTNFFVEAGAGSGKTTMLVSRMVAMVEQGKPIDKICAITFTKAAAGEFYDRFQKELIRRSNPDYVWEDKGYAGQLPAPTDETRALCAKALEDIDLCFMGTIDAFCNMVLSEHPYDAGIPSDATIMSDDEAQILMQQEYVKICEGRYGTALKEKADTFRTLHSKDLDVFINGMSILMNNRNVHWNFKDPGKVDIDKDFASERTDIINALTGLKNHPELMYDSEKYSTAAWLELPDALKVIKRKWSTNFTNVKYNLELLAKLRTCSDPADSGVMTGGLFEEHSGKGNWYDLTIGAEDGIISKLTKIQYSATMSFLSDCVEILEKAQRDKGRMTYFDYLFYLRNMLKADAAGDGRLIDYIYNRHSYFLIDEFQDTNPMQAEIFFYLTAAKPTEKWFECVPRPGSLFIVGDPKQSIYRFRGADVTSFLRVKKLFDGNTGAVLLLSRNFRSTKRMCGYFNRVFTELLKTETDTQSKFAEIPLPDEKLAPEFDGVYKYKAYSGPAGRAAYPDMTDEKQIARVILSLVDNDAYKITTEEDKIPRKLKFSDFMIITATKGNQPVILDHLKSKGIPVKVEGSVPFDTTEALSAIYDVYAAMADPGEKLIFHKALTGVLVGQLTENILKFKDAGGSETLNGADEILNTPNLSDEILDVARAVKDLKDLHARALRLSPAALFNEIMDRHMIFDRLEPENLEVIFYTLELMRNAEKAGTLVSLKDGAAYLSTLISKESGEERCLSLKADTDCVHMANLHKVKGLEAPVVILAYGANRVSSSSIRVEHLDSGTEGYIFDVTPDEKNDDGSTKNAKAFFKTDDYADEKDAEKIAAHDEIDRLVYVAATRARNALIICESYNVRNGKNGQTESLYTKWKDIIEAGTPDIFENVPMKEASIETQATQVTSESLYKKAEDECVLNDRSKETATYEEKRPSQIKLKSKVVMSDEASSTSDEVTSAKDQGDYVGSDGMNIDMTATGEEGSASIGGTAASELHRFPALLGTMTHRLMELLVLTENKIDVDAAVDKIFCEYETSEVKPIESKLKEALKKVAETIRNGGYDQENGSEKDILTILLNADEVYPEVPFCYKDESDGTQIWNGIMDVIYCKDGQWHIVDYKTNADGSALDEKYKNQLDAYIQAMKVTMGVDADARIYHIDI